MKWYNEQKQGLGKEFFKELKFFLEFVEKNPTACEEKHRNARFLPMKRFPFVIIYTVHDNYKMINIVAIFHTSRNPDKYKKTLK
ncbi:MAG: type II toxin-antitoxin system RelE/ParE family toxin [Bacteroidetes bacterium]|nr:type II toxin-antitoxin system RelE/ParE family toxin [Bacteroidota bacterium]